MLPKEAYRDLTWKTQTRETRLRYCVNSLFTLMLALLVLGWGTGYKLSLYHAHSAYESAPAKLCTRASDTAKNELDRAATAPVIDQVPTLAARFLVPTPAPAPYRVEARPATTAQASPSRSNPAAYLRPPPAYPSLNG